MGIVLLLLALLILVPFLSSRNPNRQSQNAYSQGSPQSETDTLPYNKAYQKKWLLTTSEKAFYRQLSSFAAKKNITVFTKVRLLDLVEPIPNQPRYKTYFYKVQAKHVDFVLCDTKLVARYIIELDDNSHNTPDRMKRDQFVDLVLQAVGYKVLRLNAFDEHRIEQAFFQDIT